MDYTYIIEYLKTILKDGILISPEGKYDPSFNVALMMHGITELICELKDEANQK